MIKIALIGIFILFIAVLLMGVRVFFSRKGSFPSLHIGECQAMQEKGIHCATSQDAEMNRRESPIEKLLKSQNF
ncbi:MAG TPA: hypothetical protein PLH60_08680 [Proteiniphilum sp.]|nr:hypothetical protein [Proteiniphilum sp.]HPD85766.1 hypothetical protein [Proteiniphilum sp.]HPJ50981.1 hypothetical protein [Proteiniphilum sp.]HPR20617.1 hypothetical protein [Proteiniphilum sp.]